MKSVKKKVRGLKRMFALLVSVLLILSAFGCAEDASVKNTVEGNFNTYYEMRDGTWKCGDQTYRYRLEISGRMPNAAKDSTFVYVSNIEEIPFERAYMAAGFSSDSEDYFSPEEAVLVEIR